VQSAPGGGGVRSHFVSLPPPSESTASCDQVERQQAPLALRATRPHTVGYIGGCDQEEGVIECPLLRVIKQRNQAGLIPLLQAAAAPSSHPASPLLRVINFILWIIVFYPFIFVY